MNMMRGFGISKWVTMGLCALVFFSTGCNSDKPAKESVSTVSSMRDTHAAIGKAMVQIQGANASLQRVSTTDDLNAWLKEYSGIVTKMQTDGEAAKARWFDMKEHQNEYIELWAKEADKTQNPAVQQTMDQRRQSISSDFEKLRGMAQDVRDAYQPYLQDLQSIQKAMTLDLTPAGVKALQPSIDQAKSDGDTVVHKLDALGIELDKLAGNMSPPAGT
jgi:hypothetical protein